MKVSIITVGYNAASTIETTLKTVTGQDYPDLEYIIIDGKSKDNTLEIVQQYRENIAILISEPDKGIYDAMNKGLALATGDVVAFLNADDYYVHPKVLQQVADTFAQTSADAVYGDILIVDPADTRKVRRWCSYAGFTRQRWLRGDMIGQPALFVRREAIAGKPGFDLSFRICADVEWMFRLFYMDGLNAVHLPQVLTRMRDGGVSNHGLKAKMRINREIRAIFRKHHIRKGYLSIYSKYLYKLFQSVRRPEIHVPDPATEPVFD